MKWKDKSALNKFAEVVMILATLGYFLMTYLKQQGEVIPPALPKLCVAVVLFCLGITFWRGGRKYAYMYFALGALVLALTLILL